jgi:uncharacterized tellurite resistance protein B-like protein
MLEKFFKKTEKKKENDKVLIASLLVHAAKIDENYTGVERGIIKKAIMDLYQINITQAEEVLKNAEKKEEESNQIIEFTKEIKKSSMEFRHKIIEILWKIVYSDHTTDMYESNLIRRVCGLLYVSNKDSGTIRLKVQNLK